MQKFVRKITEYIQILKILANNYDFWAKSTKS